MVANGIANIGKFKGKGFSYEHIWSSENGWAKWAAKQENPGGALIPMKEYFLHRQNGGAPMPETGGVAPFNGGGGGGVPAPPPAPAPAANANPFAPGGVAPVASQNSMNQSFSQNNSFRSSTGGQP